MSQDGIARALQLARQQYLAGRLAEAQHVYRQILSVQPHHHVALHQLGVIEGQLGRHEAATTLIRQAIAASRGNHAYHANLAFFLLAQGQIAAAIQSYRQSLALDPQRADAHYNLGSALMQSGENGQAITCFRQALQLNPSYFDACNNLGIVLTKTGAADEAVTFLERALALRPNLPDVLCNLGNAWKDQGKWPAAIECYQRTLALKPDHAIALNNLGTVFSRQGKIDQAITCYQQAISNDPQLVGAFSNLANTLKESGQIDEAIHCYRHALVLDPQFADAHSNLLHTLHFHPDADARTILEESKRWNLQHARPLTPFIQPIARDPDPNRRLKIGYLSPDFRDHAVSRFFFPLVSCHHRDAFQIFCYAQVPVPDQVTATLQPHADVWRSIVGLSDQQTAEMIRTDAIDILVDLAGHTADNRLLVFARKPAPIQITWLGYPGTTGLATMDYRFTDALADPPGDSDAVCTEQLVRLPATGWCFSPQDAPPVTELPALKAGAVTFGSFNNLAKVNPPLLKLWSRLLRSVEGSRLLIKAQGFNSPSARQRVRNIIIDEGIPSDRLTLCGWLSHADHQARFAEIDIMLDTFPYHGTTSTCEAMWMGIPVVTLAGTSHVSRVGVSLLTQIGEKPLIANSPSEYVQIAGDLARDLTHLAALRAGLRDRMQRSPLMDASRFAADVEAAYRAIWRSYCGQSRT